VLYVIYLFCRWISGFGGGIRRGLLGGRELFLGDGGLWGGRFVEGGSLGEGGGSVFEGRMKMS
jgi:hypothetical protein